MKEGKGGRKERGIRRKKEGRGKRKGRRRGKKEGRKEISPETRLHSSISATCLIQGRDKRTLE